MKRIFEHVLLTRFNVRWESRPLPDDEWLAHRFNLFNRFCYPSVRAQSNQNFRWLVLFDINTAAEFRKKVQDYSAWSNFVPMYLEEFDLERVREKILELSDGADYLITTRLDNDDALSRDYVEIVQDNFTGQTFEFLNLRHGFVWHQNSIYSLQLRSNPFISLVEKIQGPITTVWCGRHPELSRFGPIRQIESPPAWLQVIHERNLSNDVKGTKEPVEKLENRFVLDL